MISINDNLEQLKIRITKQKVIIGNSTSIIKKLISMIHNIELEVVKNRNDIEILKEAIKWYLIGERQELHYF